MDLGETQEPTSKERSDADIEQINITLNTLFDNATSELRADPQTVVRQEIERLDSELFTILTNPDNQSEEALMQIQPTVDAIRNKIDLLTRCLNNPFFFNNFRSS